MIRPLSTLTVFVTAMALTACTVFPIPEPPRIMDLAPGNSPSVAPRAHDSAIRIDTPLASSPFDGSQILIKPTAYEFQAMSRVKWRDTAPVMIRDHLVKHLRSSQGFRSVIVDTSPADARFTLVSELTAFHVAAQPDGLNVVIQLHAEVMSNQQRDSFCVRNWTITEPTDNVQTDNVVAGFSIAANRLNTELASWLSTCLNKDHKADER